MKGKPAEAILNLLHFWNGLRITTESKRLLHKFNKILELKQ